MQTKPGTDTLPPWSLSVNGLALGARNFQDLLCVRSQELSGNGGFGHGFSHTSIHTISAFKRIHCVSAILAPGLELQLKQEPGKKPTNKSRIHPAFHVIGRPRSELFTRRCARGFTIFTQQLGYKESPDSQADQVSQPGCSTPPTKKGQAAWTPAEIPPRARATPPLLRWSPGRDRTMSKYCCCD